MLLLTLQPFQVLRLLGGCFCFLNLFVKSMRLPVPRGPKRNLHIALDLWFRRRYINLKYFMSSSLLLFVVLNILTASCRRSVFFLGGALGMACLLLFLIFFSMRIRIFCLELRKDAYMHILFHVLISRLLRLSLWN